MMSSKLNAEQELIAEFFRNNNASDATIMANVHRLTPQADAEPMAEPVTEPSKLPQVNTQFPQVGLTHNLIDPDIAKRSKYGANKAVWNGYEYDSILEARHARVLETLMEKGQVRLIIRQTPFHYPAKMGKYVCDFTVWWSSGVVTFEDSKGVLTKAFKKNQKMMAHYFPNVEILLKFNKDISNLEKELGLNKFTSEAKPNG